MKTLPLFLFLLVGLTSPLFAGGDDRDMEVIDSSNNQPQELLADEETLTSVEIEKTEEKQTTELITLKVQPDQVNQETTPVSEPSVEKADETLYSTEPVEEEFKEAPKETFNDESELVSIENENQANIKISKDEVTDTKASQYELIALLTFILLVIATVYVARRNSTLTKRGKL
jgi:hypothetical protein